MHHLLEAELGDLRSLPARQPRQQHYLAAERVLHFAGKAALLTQFRQRIAPPDGIEQIGANQRVVNQRRGHLAQRLGIVCDDGSLRAGRDQLFRPAALAHEHLRRTGAVPGRTGAVAARVVRVR